MVLMARRDDGVSLYNEQGAPQLPKGLVPVGLVSFSDELRPEAKDTLQGFAQAGIQVKIISGKSADGSRVGSPGGAWST